MVDRVDYMVQDPEVKSELADILPEFHNGKGQFNLPSSTTVYPTPANANPNATADSAKGDYTDETIGAGVGAAVGRMLPKSGAVNTTAAKAKLAETSAMSREAAQYLAEQQAAHSTNVADIIKQHQAAQAGLSLARDDLNLAEAVAQRHGIDPTTLDEALSGDSWSRKVVGSMGPGGDAVTEAARNYQIQKGLNPSEASQFKAARSGLIVPNTVESTGPFYSPAQTEAVNKYAAAKTAHDAAIKAAAAAELAKSKVTATVPRAVESAAHTASKAKAAESGAKASLEELEAAKSFLSKIPYFKTLMGGLSGAELVHAYKSFQQGETLEGVMAGLSGVGGMLSMIPTPYTEAAGLAMSAVPLAYQGYKAYTGK